MLMKILFNQILNLNECPVKQPKKLLKHLILQSVLWLFCTFSLQAQSALLEEVIVTAQKREQNVQDIGISITAFSSEQLDVLGVDDSLDIAMLTPGVSYGGAAGGQFAAFTIRGVTQTAFDAHTEGPVAVYIDEGYMPMMQGHQFVGMYDLERVEVLKGPQGTLFGRNATGGLIHFITKNPTKESEGFGEFTFGSYDQTRFEGAMSGPLTENLAGRVAFLYNHHDEIYENIFPGGDDEWGEETFAGRGKLLFTPNDDIEFLVSAWGAHTEMSSAPYQGTSAIAQVDAQGNVLNAFIASPTETRECIGPGGVNTDCGSDFGVPDGILVTRSPGADFFGFIDPDGAGKKINKNFTSDDCCGIETWGINAKLTWDLGHSTLTSITDYKRLDKFILFEEDLTPIRQLDVLWDTKEQSFTQELRLNGETARTRWVAGLYYLHMDVHVPQFGFLFPPNPDTPLETIVLGLFGFTDTGVDLLLKVDQITNSYSAFGQVEYDLTDTLTLIGGLRIIQEEKDFDYVSDTFVNGVAVPPAQRLVPLRILKRDSADTLWSGKLQLDWRPNEDWLVYAGVNRGVKAGGFNAPLTSGPVTTDDEIEYAEEILIAYEAGFKATLFDGRANLNVSGFYYDYDDYQGFNFFGLSSEITNLNSTIGGIEAQFSVSLTKDLDMMFSVAYFDAEVEDVLLDFGPTDREPAYAPDFQLTGVARYQWPAFSGTMAIASDFSYTSSTFGQLTNFDATKIESYVLGNARLSYTTSDERWTAEFFVNNIADQRYKTVAFDLSLIQGASIYAYGKPQWFGVTIKHSF